MARLRILAGQMRGAVGSRNVAVRTVYVSPRVLGAASPAAASSAEVTRRALLSERSSAKYRANTKSKRFCSSHTRACLGVKGTRSPRPRRGNHDWPAREGRNGIPTATPAKWAVARDRGSAKMALYKPSKIRGAGAQITGGSVHRYPEGEIGDLDRVWSSASSHALDDTTWRG